MQYIFRNHTIEPFFDNQYFFSGYDDISIIPGNAEGFVWFYLAPIIANQEDLVSNIEDYKQKFLMVLSQIDKSKQVIALTMETLFYFSLTDDDYRVKSAICSYNDFLYSQCCNHRNLKVIDFSDFVRHFEIKDLIDWKYYFISQIVINPRFKKDFQIWYSRKMKGLALKRKKCLVLDLDNTLWGGILGENGADGILIGGDYPGKAFQFFQEGLMELYKNGIVLTVCSKNNEEDVLEAWDKNPFLILRKEHFAAYRINWVDKATNIKEIASELNLGLDSFVFFDDNPSERELVRQMLPMVEVPDFPDQPYELPLFLQNVVNDFFKVYSITDEDKVKTKVYMENALRAQDKRNYTNYIDYLKSLDIQITIEPANDYNIQRIAQMTQKTNQFNLTTYRYTEADINNILKEQGLIWVLSVADKFGNSGITGCVIIKENEIDTFLMSCRILGKEIEYVFINKILEIMKKKGLENLKATYIPTLKNSQVAEFYEKSGFSLQSENNGTKHYVINLTDRTEFNVKDYYSVVIK